MKKIVCMLIIIMIVIFSWVIVIKNGNEDYKKYNMLIEKAKELKSDELYVDALGCYNDALSISDDIEIKFEILKLYKSLNMFSTFEKYAKEIYDSTGSFDAVVSLGEYYEECGKFEKAIEWYEDKLSDFSKNKKIEELNIVESKLDKLKGYYTKMFDYYDNISNFYNGYAICSKSGKLGIINACGKSILRPQYIDIGVFGEMGNKLIIAPVKIENDYFFVDKKGYKRKKLKNDYSYVGSYSLDGLVLAKINNKYVFLDENLNELDKYFDYATQFSDGISVIKDTDGYKIVDSSFDYISSSAYEGVKINELGYASSCGLMYMKKNSKYLLVDNKGNELTDPMYDDVMQFIDKNEYAAVKINGKWGFIDSCGNIVIKPSYEQAGSFSCGLAPVKINEKWGYINRNGEIVIEPEFVNAKSFNSKGYAPVCMSQWYIIKLEYIERR